MAATCLFIWCFVFFTLCYVTVAKCNYHDLLRHKAANKIQWNNLSQAADLMKNPPISVPPPEKASLMEVKESEFPG